jgi:dihydroneopterin aldolase
MKVYIKELTFDTIIGILDFERIKKQKVIVDVSFEYDFENDKFIDYSKVSKLIEKTMKQKKFKLIEEAILHLQEKLNNKFKLNNLVIKITKPNILKNCKVSVEG